MAGATDPRGHRAGGAGRGARRGGATPTGRSRCPRPTTGQGVPDLLITLVPQPANLGGPVGATPLPVRDPRGSQRAGHVPGFARRDVAGAAGGDGRGRAGAATSGAGPPPVRAGGRRRRLSGPREFGRGARGRRGRRGAGSGGCGAAGAVRGPAAGGIGCRNWTWVVRMPSRSRSSTLPTPVPALTGVPTLDVRATAAPSPPGGSTTG